MEYSQYLFYTLFRKLVYGSQRAVYDLLNDGDNLKNLPTGVLSPVCCQFKLCSN